MGCSTPSFLARFDPVEGQYRLVLVFAVQVEEDIHQLRPSIRPQEKAFFFSTQPHDPDLQMPGVVDSFTSLPHVTDVLYNFTGFLPFLTFLTFLSLLFFPYFPPPPFHIPSPSQNLSLQNFKKSL